MHRPDGYYVKKGTGHIVNVTEKKQKTNPKKTKMCL